MSPDQKYARAYSRIAFDAVFALKRGHDPIDLGPHGYVDVPWGASVYTDARKEGYAHADAIARWKQSARL